jgi:hypothetical protein
LSKVYSLMYKIEIIVFQTHYNWKIREVFGNFADLKPYPNLLAIGSNSPYF